MLTLRNNNMRQMSKGQDMQPFSMGVGGYANLSRLFVLLMMLYLVIIIVIKEEFIEAGFLLPQSIFSDKNNRKFKMMIDICLKDSEETDH